jgi:two-component system, chemotaxis family, CheB/CheR fusion protein
VHIYGQTGKYLEPATGKPGWNILEMAREGLKLKLASAIRQAASQKKEVIYKSIQVKLNRDVLTLNLTVKPVIASGVPEGMEMVIFQEAGDSGSKKSSIIKEKGRSIEDERAVELEETLKLTKENLQSTIEELESSNEELQTAVEEYQSTNEELQSTNEELETSREELESMNEELLTLNAEHQEKIEELSRTNDDVKNLLNSTDIATVFLDKELRIKRFTPPVTRIFPLIEGDTGRPITDFTSQIVNEDIEAAMRQVFKTLVPQEREVQTRDETWYLLKILPYRTTENAIAGLTLTLVDITRQRELTALKLALEYTLSIITTLRDPILVLDADLKIISANRSFYQIFRVTPQDTENKLIYELGDKQWDIPQLRELLEKILPESTTIENYLVEHDFPGIGHHKILLNARRIFNEKVKFERILLAMEDVTGHTA